MLVKPCTTRNPAFPKLTRNAVPDPCTRTAVICRNGDYPSKWMTSSYAGDPAQNRQHCGDRVRAKAAMKIATVTTAARLLY